MFDRYYECILTVGMGCKRWHYTFTNCIFRRYKKRTLFTSHVHLSTVQAQCFWTINEMSFSIDFLYFSSRRNVCAMYTYTSHETYIYTLYSTLYPVFCEIYNYMNFIGIFLVSNESRNDGWRGTETGRLLCWMQCTDRHNHQVISISADTWTVQLRFPD